MTTVAHNKSKQLSLNAKVNFSLVLPYALCSLLSLATLKLSQQASNILPFCLEHDFNMLHTYTHHASNHNQNN